jgi:hypothetical protein
MLEIRVRGRVAREDIDRLGLGAEVLAAATVLRGTRILGAGPELITVRRLPS